MTAPNVRRRVVGRRHDRMRPPRRRSRTACPFIGTSRATRAAMTVAAERCAVRSHHPACQAKSAIMPAAASSARTLDRAATADARRPAGGCTDEHHRAPDRSCRRRPSGTAAAAGSTPRARLRRADRRRRRRLRPARDRHRLPLPDERGPPDHASPQQPRPRRHPRLRRRGRAPLSGGCTVGVNIFGRRPRRRGWSARSSTRNSCCDEPGQATNPGALIRDAAGALRKKPDKSNRVAIDLNAPPPPIAGRLSL